jgi:hypothetical protein
MTSTALTSHRQPDCPPEVPSLWSRAAARIHNGRLDRELATGIPAWDSPRHAARALQLTSRGHRQSLAKALARLLADARHPTAGARRASSVVPCRRSILGCSQLIQELSAVLDGDLPLDARQVARLQVLAHDGVGPLYRSDRGDELSSALQTIRAGLIAEG